MPTSYAGFFSAGAPTAGQLAVANTVTTGGKTYQPTAGATWATPTVAGAAGYVASTLPPHMRSAVAGQPGAAGAYYPNYYGAYQATPSAAQS